MTQSNLPNKILIVDDDPSVAQSLEEPLQHYQIKVQKAANLETAMYLFNQNRFEVVLIELEFAPLPGLALVQKWREHELEERRTVGIILMSGNKTLGKNEGLIREVGNVEVIHKPFGTVQILPFLSRALATRRRLQAYQEMQQKVVDYYEKTGDLDKAAEQIQKRLDSLGPQGLDMLYDLYEKAERFDDALKIIEPMLQKDPNSIALLNAKGRLLLRQGRYQEAKSVMEKADKLAPQNIERLNEMATMYLHLQQPDESVAKFKELLDVNPENPDIKFEMFSKLYDHGYEEHAVNFGKETTTPMEIVRHYNNKGVILSKDGDTDNACLEYERALKFFPKFRQNYRILFNIALAKLQYKNRESYLEAQEYLNKCLELSPNFEKARKTLQSVEKALAGGKKAS